MHLLKSKVYELALSSIKEQCINDFLQGYLPDISPILAEYGGRFMINGIIQNASAGKFPAGSFAILEWPSIDHFVKINEDKRVIPLVQRRNQYLDFIIEGCFYVVQEDNNVEFPAGKKLSLILTDRDIPDDRYIRLQRLDDVRNTPLSGNLYISTDAVNQNQFDMNKDVEELSVQIPQKKA